MAGRLIHRNRQRASEVEEKILKYGNVSNIAHLDWSILWNVCRQPSVACDCYSAVCLVDREVFLMKIAFVSLVQYNDSVNHTFCSAQVFNSSLLCCAYNWVRLETKQQKSKKNPALLCGVSGCNAFYGADATISQSTGSNVSWCITADATAQH